MCRDVKGRGDEDRDRVGKSIHPSSVHSMIHSLQCTTRTEHNAAPHSTAQHSTAQRSTAQHSTAQHSTAQHSTAQHSTAQRSAAYHRVTTLGVIGRSGSPKVLASPKSANFNEPLLLYNRLLILMSRWTTQLSWRCATAYIGGANGCTWVHMNMGANADRADRGKRSVEECRRVNVRTLPSKV